jgi:hypothetical protein
VAAPDALAPAVDQAYGDGGHGGSAQHQQHRLGIFVDADQLAVYRGDDDGGERPAAPLQPARHREAQAVTAGEFGERAFRTKNAAPDPPQSERGDDHERPPDAPEHELGEQGEVVQHAGVLRRHGKKGRHRHQGQVEHHHRPLHADDEAAVAPHGIAQALQTRGGEGRHGAEEYRLFYFHDGSIFSSEVFLIPPACTTAASPVPASSRRHTPAPGSGPGGRGSR